MFSKFLYYPPKGDGVDTQKTEVHYDRSIDEIQKDPKEYQAYLIKFQEDTAKSLSYNFRIAVPRYGRWMGKDGNEALAELTAGKGLGFGGMLYPWIRISDNEALVGISAVNLNDKFRNAGIETASDLARFEARKITFDLRSIQTAYFKSINKPELLL